MIRGISVLMCLLCVCTACSPSVTPVVDGFRCQAHIVYDGTDYVGTLDRTDPTAAELTLSEPLTMNGLSMRWDGTAVSVRYLGMELTLREEELPIGAVIRVLCDTLDQAVTTERFQGTSRIEGESACGPFALTLDETNGLPLCLEVPTIGFEVTFSSWEVSA